MKDAKLSLVYGIGSIAKSKEYGLLNEHYLDPLKKQDLISFPLITSITIRLKKQQKKKDLFSIYVGKEINLNAYNDYYIEKYDLDEEELERLKNEGYKRACILNYKKYDLVLIGLKEFDKVVPDYFALKRNVDKLSQLQKTI